MLRRSLQLLLGTLMTLALAGCNFPGAAPAGLPSSQDQAATGVAATLTAAAPASAQTPFASPAPAFTPVPSATAGKPLLTITGDSNCRTGPAASFTVVTSFSAGTELSILAKNTPSNYWLVAIPTSTDTCWVSGENAKTSGDLAAIPEATANAPASKAPSKPGSLHYSYTCTSSSISVSLSWADAASDETGYHVYRAGVKIADLPANSTTYNDTVNAGPPQDLQYSVTAYNASGESDPRVAQFTACP